MSCLNCPDAVVLADEELASQAKVFDKSCCFEDADLGLNLFSGLLRIEQAIKDATDASPAVPRIQGVLHFNIPAQALTGNDILDFVFGSAYVDTSIISIGVVARSALFIGDILLELVDYTNLEQKGATLTLNVAAQAANDNDGGVSLGTLPQLSTYGMKYTYTQPFVFNCPTIDVYIGIEFSLV